MNEVPLEEVVGRIIQEAESLKAILPAALEVRYEASPKTRRFESDRLETFSIPDPTADIALDAKRLALSEQIRRSRSLLAGALIHVIGVRRGIERTLAAWEGLDEK